MITGGNLFNKLSENIPSFDLLSKNAVQISEGGFFSSIIDIPIDVSETFRLESDIGFAAFSDEYRLNDFMSDESSTSWKIGVGVFGLKKYKL